MEAIRRFVNDIEKSKDPYEIEILKNLWRNKTMVISQNLNVAEEEEGDRLKLLVLKGAEAIIIHKPTDVFIYIENISSVELETLRYLVIKKKGVEADNDFVSLAYEYLSVKNKGKIGIINKINN
ncbi:hypothetical protein BFU36_09915 [Sulfolobus sp. A20]|uniref:hypothetical protein n=1 Tax=Saccharolobus sp. A20 TaxID=1891280 RepID=UPI00084616FF|nr:hypothetical protein [Sulfolobus sp. A20]TRM77981.1 hypothetical protein DJ532_02765 [Sulfolobus sp. A20-N-F8]TRM78055.1 hypothetical protein DJ528_05565 [Sulfolobus sp. B5]TRM81272.1 hypothetical protein DJ524_04630 [Sulfolobus sp. D5]TRM85932.1 hypothetical protein DJ526_10515 [Sulfolobus sp. A20-N-G8]TRM87393.1 hypothetical protein DJ529_08540 [Sulfolobus sp. C3]TRM98782.1 hypothetical protein DJ527_09825 [Sulfolobus sp. F1]